MQDALVFNIQRYSLHDGPGIRMLVFFKGCSLHCAWCANPEGISPLPEIKYNQQLCIGCKKCLDCPKGATEFRPEDGFTINRTLCNACGHCTEVCPSAAKSIWGKRMSIEELIQKITRDQAFFEVSGGGLTVGGGEPVLQYDALLALLKAAKKRNLDTAIETAGCYQIQKLLNLTPYLNTIFFDLKAFDAQIHKELAGGQAELIRYHLEELDRHLSNHKSPPKLVIRLPFLPERNFRMEDMAGLGLFFKSLSSIDHIEVLPFHNFGLPKYEQTGKPYPLHDLKNVTQEEVFPYVEALAKCGIPVRVVTW